MIREIRILIRSYIMKNRPRSRSELDWFRKQETLQEAIEKAAFAEDSRGKRLTHQRRIKRAALEQANEILITNIKAIEKAKDFDRLFILVSVLLRSVKGLGELYIYDTTLRIGVKKGMLPKKVFLHSGTRAGAQALGLDAKAKTIEKSTFVRMAPEFEDLEPYEIEDFLCIYKSKLQSGSGRKETNQ